MYCFLFLMASYPVGCFLDPIAPYCIWFNHLPALNFVLVPPYNVDLCKTYCWSHMDVRMYSDFADHFDVFHALKLKHYSQD